MGVASANSIRRGFEGDARKYSALDKLFPAISYSFGYITKTAYTWKQPIENAVFTVDCSELFDRLEQPDFVKKFDEGFPVGITHPVFLEGIHPSSFTQEKKIIRWEFSGKVPEDGISANILVLFIPASSEDLPIYLAEQEIKSLKEGISKVEYLGVLEGYYARLIKGAAEDEKPFTKKYFEPFKLLKSQLLFEKDQKALEVILDKLKVLTTSDSR